MLDMGFIRDVKKIAAHTTLPIVAAGGISTADHVREALQAGASAVQLYSALIFEGPGLPHRINQELLSALSQQPEHPPEAQKTGTSA